MPQLYFQLNGFWITNIYINFLVFIAYKRYNSVLMQTKAVQHYLQNIFSLVAEWSVIMS